ncbi:unnamed protein product [Closterium sp. NIES-53]
MNLSSGFRSHTVDHTAGDNGGVSSSLHRECRFSRRALFSLPAPSKLRLNSRKCVVASASANPGEVANSGQISAARASAPAGQIPPPPDATSLTAPAFVVWGANTGVGKTLVSAGLAVALLARAARGGGAEGAEEGRGNAADGGRGVQGETAGNCGEFHLDFPDLRVSPCEWNTCPDSDARLVMLAAAHCAGSGSSGSEISATATTTGNNTTSSNSNSTTSSDDSAGSTIASHSPSLHFTLHSPNYSDAPSTHTISSHSPSPSAVAQSPAHNHPSLQSPTPTVSLTCSTLWAWKDPVSPHLAARESRAVPGRFGSPTSSTRCDTPIH